ncbi:MAG: DUF5702 domain-containing protein [Lachnospiraceae bacterium]|nr:DUF5702 domain-containing protein [Lachnospiraceae bacterium]
MNNKGKVTIFLCLFMSALLCLITTTYDVSNLYAAKAKVAMATRTALSCVKAEYNQYIFDQYHILLFDMNNEGLGRGGVEEKIEKNLQENLGDGFTVNEVAIIEEKGLLDDDYSNFKKQIKEIVPYVEAESCIDKLQEETGGKDGKLPDDVVYDMDAAENEKTEEAEEKEETEDKPHGKKKKDPRKFTKKLKTSGLLKIVAPTDLEINSTCIDLSDTVSVRHGKTSSFFEQANMEFDDYDALKKDLNNHASWSEQLINAGEGVIYASKVFNCAVGEKKNDTTVFDFEQEYLICGYSSDYQNLKNVVNRLVAIRFPLDYVCLVKDASKMTILYDIAFPLSFLTMIPASVLKYLLAGGWAYVEAIADVRQLLHGRKIEFVKRSENWITDIDNLGDSVMSDVDSEKGMDYSEYLLILLAIEKSNIYNRMLDLIEMNTRLVDEDFSLDNCAIFVGVDVEVSFGGRKIYVNESFEY